MKRIVIIVLLGLVMAGCQQQKEEPKASLQYPAGPLQMQDNLKLAQEAVKADPKNVRAWIEMGNILMDTSRFNEAVEAYQKALDLDPKNVDVRVDMGTCYQNSGRPDRAVTEFREALEINPNHALGHFNLGVVLAATFNDRGQAVKEFEKYLQLEPNAPNAAQVRQEIQNLKVSK